MPRPSMRPIMTRGDASGSRLKCAIVFAVIAFSARSFGPAMGKTIIERAIVAGSRPTASQCRSSTRTLCA